MGEVLGIRPERQGSPEFMNSMHGIENSLLELQGGDFPDVEFAREMIVPILRAIHAHNMAFPSGERTIAEVTINSVEVKLDGKPFNLELTRFGHEVSMTDHLNLVTISTSDEGPDFDDLREIRRFDIYAVE